MERDVNEPKNEYMVIDLKSFYASVECVVNIPTYFEPPVRNLRATIPASESHKEFELLLT